MVGGGNRAVRQACWGLRVAMCSGCRHEAWNRMVERGCHRFGLLASGTVHDAGFSGVRRHVLRNPCGFAFGFHPDDVEIEVWTVESSDGNQRVTQVNQRNDVATHFACCGRGERGDNRPNRKRVNELADTQIRGAEILPPLRNAMRLVHRDQRDARVYGKIAESPGFQTFRGNIQHANPALGSLGEHGVLLVRALRGVDVRRENARVL